MRKLLIGLVAVVAILVGVVLVGPSFIDWNSYKGQIESQAEAFTGRKLTIGGDISIQVLPAPALVARDIAFANAPQSEVENMLELGSMEVRVALGPLFSGEIQVSKIVLVEPVIELEKFADGTNNWTIDIGQAGGETSTEAEGAVTDASSEDGADALAGITLDHFSLERGTLVFRDHAAGATHVVEDINATLKAASLQGPFEATGSLRTMDLPLRFEVGVDGIFQGRTAPVTGNLTVGDDAVTVSVTGNILNMLTAPKFNGTLGIEAKSLSRAAALAGADDLPPMLNRRLSLSAPVQASADGAVLDGFKMSLGETSVNGRVDVALGDVPKVDVALTVPHLNADEWLAGSGGGATTATNNQQSGSGGSEAGESAQQASGGTAAFSLPDTVDANLDLTIDSIVYRGEKAGPVQLSAGLASGEVTVSQMTAQLPGAADISLFGFLTAADGEPSLNGEAEISIGDTRGLARWLGVALDNVPADRLRRLDAKATIVGNAKQLQIANVKASFDSTNLSGGLTLALRDRLSFGAAVSIDSINLDPYLAGMSTETSAAGGQSGGAASGNAGGTAATPEANPYSALGALKDFDANVRFNAGEITYNGLPIRKIAVDATLYEGDLTLRDVSVADAGGASLAVDGKIGGLGGIPELSGLNVALKASDAGRLAKLANVDLPVPSKALGQISLKATVNGNALQPAIKGSVGAAGGTVWIDGKASTIPVAPLYEGALRIAHPDTAGLLKALETGYTPSGKIGGVDLSMSTSVTADKVSLFGIKGALNQTAVSGDAGISLGGARPRLEGALTLDQFRVDPFLPKEQAQSASSGGSSSSSGGTASAGYAKGEAPWPKDPIDLSGLGAADARLTLNVGRLSYQKIDFDKAVVKLTLDDRLLTVEQLSGVAFGGNLGFAGAVNGRATPAANGSFSFKNASISSLLTAVIGEAAAIGALNVETAFDASGASVADMVAALNGNGAFSMKGVDVTGSTQGSAMSGFLGLIRGFGQIGAGLGGKKLDGLAYVGGKFVIKQGVASVNPLSIDSALGTGTAGGTVDLAGWNMDMNGNLDVSGNLLTAILGQKLGGVTKLSFSMKGPLDAPDVNVDTGNLQGVGIPVPGLDKLEEKLPGVGSILQGVLGGGQQQQSSGSTSSGSNQGTTSEPPPQPSQQQQKKLKPEKLLKDLLGF